MNYDSGPMEGVHTFDGDIPFESQLYKLTAVRRHYFLCMGRVGYRMQVTGDEFAVTPEGKGITHVYEVTETHELNGTIEIKLKYLGYPKSD